jgi:preprotein translocase subunit SecE
LPGKALFAHETENSQDAMMAKANPLQFIQQVRSEIAKVVWPTRREVVLTTIMVFIMAALTATFFSLIDLTIRTGLSAVINSFG